jgi:hypothetical protein
MDVHKLQYLPFGLQHFSLLAINLVCRRPVDRGARISPRLRLTGSRR